MDRVSRKILIIDDEPDIIEPLALLLEYEGYTVAHTSKSQEVFSKIAEFEPQIILLDILLSGDDGRQICKQLKENKKTSDLVVILMSAHPSAKEDSFKSGADDFIAKPFDTADLYKTVEKFFYKTNQTLSLNGDIN